MRTFQGLYIIRNDENEAPFVMWRDVGTFFKSRDKLIINTVFFGDGELKDIKVTIVENERVKRHFIWLLWDVEDTLLEGKCQVIVFED